MKRNVVIITELEILKKTGAAFTRIIEYANGISKNNYISVFITSILVDNKEFTKEEILPDIFICGEEYEYKKNYFIIKYFNFFKKNKEINFIIKNLLISKQDNVILVYNSFGTFWEEIIFLWKLKKNKFRVITERNERSLGIILNKMPPSGLVKKVVFYLLKCFEIINSLIKDELVRFYEGVIVISNPYKEWVSKRNKNQITIPILANSKLFSTNLFENIMNWPYKIGYSGTITFDRDGVDLLIDTMNILVNILEKSIILTITGNGSKRTLLLMNKKIEEYKLADTIRYLGYVEQEDLIDIIQQQDLFVILRMDNIQSRYSFSSKIAEYMALGKLVLTTKVSDNAIYIKDEINGFLLNDLNPNSIARKLLNIFDMPKYELDMIKTAARETAKQHFYIHQYSNQLVNLLFPGTKS